MVHSFATRVVPNRNIVAPFDDGPTTTLRYSPFWTKKKQRLSRKDISNEQLGMCTQIITRLHLDKNKVRPILGFQKIAEASIRKVISEGLAAMAATADNSDNGA